jgi:hypothetical protein
MSEQLQVQIDNLNNEIAIWNNFSNAVSKLNESEVKREGVDNYQMVWTSNEVDYYFDHSTLTSIDKFVARRAGIITNVKYNVPNYNLRKGIKSCLKQIEIEINKLQSAKESLEQNL